MNFNYIEIKNLFGEEKYNFVNDRKSKRSNIYFPTYRRTERDLSELIKSRYFNLDNNDKNYYNNGNNIVIGLDNEDLNILISNAWINIAESEKNIINELLSKMFLRIIQIKENSNMSKFHNLNVGKLNDDIKAIFDKTKLSNNLQSCDGFISKYTNDIKKAADMYMNPEIPPIDDNCENILKSEILDQLIARLNFMNQAEYSFNIIQDIIEEFNNKNIQIDKIKLPLKNIEDVLRKFMSPKEAKFENGKLVFYLNNKELSFKDLSAGEKQLVTLFIHICLGLDTKGICIIDEPELSLHINWQRELLMNLLKCRDDVQYITATHSPYILSDFDEEIVVMGELGDE